MNNLLGRLKTRLELTEDTRDGLLLELLEDAKAACKAYTMRERLPEECATAVVKLAVVLFNRIGMEGENSHTKGGITTQVYNLMPSDVADMLRPYRLAKVGI